MSRASAPQAGDRAPEFSLPSLDGGDQVTLASLLAATGGGPVLLAFFRISCPTCQYTFPFLERLRSFPVVAISQNDAEGTREFHQTFGITLPTLLDPAGDGYLASNAWHLSHVPSLFLVDPDGTILFAGTGFRRADLEMLGGKFGAQVFALGEATPAFRPG